MKLSKKVLPYFIGFSLLIGMFLIVLGEANADVGNANITSKNQNAESSLSGPTDGVFNSVSPNGTVTVTLGAWRNLRPTESYLHGVSLLSPDYSVNCLTPDQASKGWAVGNGGVILSYCNGIWDHAIIVESIPTDLYAVQAISPTLGVAVGDQGAVLMYLWDRIALNWVWTKSPIPVGNEILYGVSIIPDGTGSYTAWAVGHSDESGKGTLVHGTITPTTYNGHPTHSYTWENVTGSYPNLPDVTAYFAVQMLSPTNGWAVGGVWPDKGVIIHWDGTGWSLFQQTGSHTLYGLNMRSASDGWSVGQDGVIYHFNGKTWSSVTSPTEAILTDVGFTPEGEGWIVGYNGTLLKYAGNGWELFTDLRTDRFDFRALDFSSGHGWAVGAHFDVQMGGQILEYSDNLWLAVTPPTDNRLNHISVLDDNDAWAVGNADADGGTIIHWDGKHWQRWYQPELPIPASDLQAIYMVSPDEGWAAGDPLASEEPAVFLHWDDHRWEQPRYDAPINVRVNDIAMLDKDFGWAVADNGNAVAKYDGLSGYWSANHTCGGAYYQLRGTSIIPYSNIFGWDAWAVGTKQGVNPPFWKEWFLRYQPDCSGGYAWDTYDVPDACPIPTPTPPPPPDPTQTPAPTPDDGPVVSNLYGIVVNPDLSGYAVGEYKNRASIYKHTSDDISRWKTYFCQDADSLYNPSKFYTAAVVKDSGVGWFGGYYTDPNTHIKVAYISYDDANGRSWADIPYPRNGRYIYHRPVKSIDMSSDTMGWAVGDSESEYSVIYQYPFPNFTLNASPDFRAVIPGNSTYFTATVFSLGGFSSNVTLSVSNLPPGATATITPPSITTGDVATIQIDTSSSTLLGVYTIYLTGEALFQSGDHDLPVSRDTSLRLTVTNDPVLGVSPSSGPAGTIVMISGSNFGSDPGAGNRSTTTNHVVLAGKQMPDASVISWSNTQISVNVPDNSVLFPKGPVLDVVTVTAGNYISNNDYTFQLENHLEDVEIVRGTGIVTVTLTGTSFGNDPGSLFRATDHEHITLGGVRIANNRVHSWSNNIIVFTVDTTTPTGLVAVTSNGFESNALVVALSSNALYLPLVKK